jgi:hypothetical protein
MSDANGAGHHRRPNTELSRRLEGQVAPLPLLYLGMLGSRRKAVLTAKQLREWGVPDESIGHIHGPVGLAIGADTPEEIAVSIVAQMIAVRRRGSDRRGGMDEAVAASGSAYRNAVPLDMNAGTRWPR